MNQSPLISIVTPSFNMLTYFKMCCASVDDQGVAVEHIIMDGGSTDGTAEWLASKKDVISLSEKDKGMYDGLNKAIDRTRGDIIGHLNCDEQYLPGTLQAVVAFFDSNPDVDFVAADFLVVNPDGEFIAYRKSFRPRWQYFFSNYLYTLTCTLFYRRRIFDTCRFNAAYKSIADVIFLYGIMKKRFRGAHLRRYVSVFTYSGENLSLSPISLVEKNRFNRTLPRAYRLMKPLFFLLFFVERFLHGTYREETTLSYLIFTPGNPVRKEFVKHNPGYRLNFKPTAR
jgi:glycosyltransferase involved in cell wall biosynthesis